MDQEEAVEAHREAAELTQPAKGVFDDAAHAAKFVTVGHVAPRDRARDAAIAGFAVAAVRTAVLG